MRHANVLAAAAAMTLAGGVAACGGSSSTVAPASPGVVLTRAYTQTVGARTADVAYTVKEETAGKTVQVSGKGAFNWSAEQGSLTSSVDVPGPAAGNQSFSFQEVLADGAVYLKLPPQLTKAAGVTEPWLKIPVKTGDAFSAGPSQELQLLISESDDVTEAGSATVDGVPTTEYTATVDPSQAAAKLPADLQAKFAQVAAVTGLKTVPIKAYIDSAGRAVRVIATVSLTVPAGPSTGGSPQPITTVEQFDYSNYGAPVSVTLPPADQVGTSSALDSRL